MRPLSLSRPKPLISLAGKVLIDHALDRLTDAGVTTAAVNVHYLADQLVAHLECRDAPSIIICDEREGLLDTGGGTLGALGVIGERPFFT
ncbi:MAG: nucleotidyltransferase family protein, partial [Rhizobiales bacterium]|nr:nucleotidyltransferase family protein [Hyphomicrobiales bacterium]